MEKKHFNMDSRFFPVHTKHVFIAYLSTQVGYPVRWNAGSGCFRSQAGLRLNATWPELEWVLRYLFSNWRKARTRLVIASLVWCNNWVAIAIYLEYSYGLKWFAWSDIYILNNAFYYRLRSPRFASKWWLIKLSCTQNSRKSINDCVSFIFRWMNFLFFQVPI